MWDVSMVLLLPTMATSNPGPYVIVRAVVATAQLLDVLSLAFATSCSVPKKTTVP